VLGGLASCLDDRRRGAGGVTAGEESGSEAGGDRDQKKK